MSGNGEQDYRGGGAMNYVDTFIAVADDCPAAEGVVPRPRGDRKTVAVLQYEMISGVPCTLTQEDVQFESWFAGQEGLAEADRGAAAGGVPLDAEGLPARVSAAEAVRVGSALRRPGQGRVVRGRLARVPAFRRARGGRDDRAQGTAFEGPAFEGPAFAQTGIEASLITAGR
jgi:hypothetical protein